jgi:hypothetical protein
MVERIHEIREQLERLEAEIEAARQRGEDPAAREAEAYQLELELVALEIEVAGW